MRFRVCVCAYVRVCVSDPCGVCVYAGACVLIILVFILCVSGGVRGEDEAAGREDGEFTIESDIGSDREGSRTDDGVVAREEEAIKLDGLNVAQVSGWMNRLMDEFIIIFNILMVQVKGQQKCVNKIIPLVPNPVKRTVGEIVDGWINGGVDG